MKTTTGVLLFLSLFGLNSGLFRRHYHVSSYMFWEDAQTYCRNNYDDLSTASGPDLKALSKVVNIRPYNYWIGLHSDTSQHIWKWSEGGKAKIQDWAHKEPKIYYEKCGCVRTDDSKVRDCDCYWSIPFFCMNVYELVLVKQESTWEEALDYCRQNYLDLAILYSAVVMTEAKNNSTNAQTDELWTGLRFLSGRWLWVNGEELQYKAWSGGQELQCPAMNQRCGVYNRQEMAWKPEDCEKKLNFLCVKKA
ncbi:lymphocyte antigen 75-like [Paramisgurnus dabryanus]|uniref:lymphocyte antigen 75-like n=1 Tax=Paramisgurnus dabryanus TaxID=90735 RepID=UPI0031F426DC